MAPHTVHINRAPVLTLWAAVAAERLGMFEGAKGPQEAREPMGRQPG
jgi:hypothetical protein